MNTNNPKAPIQQKIEETIQTPEGKSEDFAKRRTLAASIGGVVGCVGAIVMTMIGLSPNGIDTTLGKLPERIQIFTLVFGFFYTLIAYRLFTYHRSDVTDYEREAELLVFRSKNTWKYNKSRGFWLFSLTISLLIRIAVGFIVVLMVNFFWALVVLPPINHSNVFQVMALQFFTPKPDLIQLWIMGVYGLIFGYALVYMLVGVDDSEHAVGHMVYLSGSLGLMWLVADRQIRLPDIRLGITNVLTYFGAAQAAILNLLSPKSEAATVIANSLPPLKSISALGTIEETRTLFSLLIVVLGIFTLALARDAVNDWWWMEEVNPATNLRLRDGGLWKLRWLVSILLVAAIFVALFPTAIDDENTVITRLHLIGGLTCGGVILLLMLVIPRSIPESYGRNYWSNFVKQLEYFVRFRKLMPVTDEAKNTDDVTKWFVRLSWFLLVASFILVIVYAIYNPDGRAIFFIEVVIFPAGGIWTYLFNWYSKQHIRGLSAGEWLPEDREPTMESDATSSSNA